MGNLWTFVKAVLHHWGLLVTGLFLTLIFGGIEHYLQTALSCKYTV